MSNKNLHEAKKAKNDEFYTQLPDIKKELCYYKSHFENKVVYCNCDTEDSNFVKYFRRQPVKELIVSNGIDFRSPESIELLKEADIVVTNPPFSLFREYIAQLIEYDKKFVIVGNMNAITYKEVFPLLKDNKIWLGVHNNQSFVFKTPYTNDLEANRKFCIQKGYTDPHYVKVPAINWYTNIDHAKRHEDIILFRTYYGNEESYSTYDNYNAINVDKIKDIPVDYEGLMGVPITFLNKYNPNQFELLGTSDNGLIDDKYKTFPGLTEVFVKDYYKSGGTGTYREGNPTAGHYVENVAKMVYKRLFIRNKMLKNDYPKYDNYNAIEVSKVKNIPSDYEGTMGVPITFLTKYNPDQFEICGTRRWFYDTSLGITNGKTIVNGKETYDRIFIKNKKLQG